jgi:RNA-splicing ligase RtcB
MKDAIAPAAVGVDIGCGMAAQLTSLTSRSSERAAI